MVVMEGISRSGFSRLFAICCLSIMSLPTALACSDPTLHPEWAEFNAEIKSLGQQPKLPLQVFHRVSPEKIGDDTRVVSLAFRQTQEVHDQAVISVTPSEHLSLLTPVDNLKITEKTVKLKVRPEGAGVHHLRVIVTLSVDADERRNTILVPVTAGLHRLSPPLSANPSRPTALPGSSIRK